MPNDELKQVVEALLFATEKPMSLAQIGQAFEEAVPEGEVREILETLKAEYEATSRGFRLFEIAGGYQLVTDPKFSSYLKRLYQSREKKRLSQASLETLSIVAYRQPLTRADMEAIRGVNVDGAIKTLLEKGLVRIVGRKEVPGRPMLYGTTEAFLDHFGLASLKELPPLTEFTEKDIAEHLLTPEAKQKMAMNEASEEMASSGISELPEETSESVGSEKEELS